MKIINCEQGSELWLQTRLGICSASHFKDILAKGKGKAMSKTRQTYLYQLASEKLTGLVQPSFKNDAMEWGTEQEPYARKHYEKVEGVEVKQVGFVFHSDSIGCSPDGFVGDCGLVEIKCPKTPNQIQWIENDKVPTEHMAQIQGQMWVCDREWCDFVSFDPRIIDGPSGYFKKRVERDDEYIKNLSDEVDAFLFQLSELMQRRS